MKKIKVFETFSGVGGWSFGLKEENIPHEVIGHSEIDKWAIKCFEQNHGKIQNFGDITKINPKDIPDFDLMCNSPPCQSFSVAGLSQGKDDTRGRGRLFENTIHIMREKRPRWAIYENVKGLTFRKHREYLNYIIQLMRDSGYYVIWKVLNTKNYGVPQNRERIFIICFREKEDYKKFTWPTEEPLKLRVKDILEKEVDEKYRLSEEQIKRLVSRERSFNERFCKKETSPTLQARDYKDPKVIEEPLPYDVYNNKIKLDGISPTLTEPHHNSLRLIEPQNIKTRDINVALEVAQNKANEDGKPVQLDVYHLKYGQLRPLSTYIPQESDISRCLQCFEPKEILVEPLTFTKNKKIDKILQHPSKKSNLTYELTGDTPSGISRQGDRIFNLNKYSPTLNCTQKEYIFSNPGEYNLRKLTPKECFRLQGFLRDQINLDGISDSQKYKLAGNGLSINVISRIFRQLFKDLEDNKENLNSYII